MKMGRPVIIFDNELEMDLNCQMRILIEQIDRAKSVSLIFVPYCKKALFTYCIEKTNLKIPISTTNEGK